MRLKSALPRRADRCCASFHSARISCVHGGSSGDGNGFANASESVARFRLAATGTRFNRVACATGAPAGSVSTYSESAGTSAPALSVKAATAASGNIVSLRPGMYTVDRRSRAIASSALPRGMASAGQAMWMPISTLPFASSRIEKASSISVVVASSMEKARTSARGRSGTAGSDPHSGNAMPLGKASDRKRLK